MRIRRKKHLKERLGKLSDILYVAGGLAPDLRQDVGEGYFFDFPVIFGNENPVEIEIGCGKGGFIVEKAKEDSEVNFFAVELLDNIVAMAGERVVREGVSNVRLFNCGADYLKRYIKQNSVRAIYLNFSPPFNGKRYENRRLTKPALVSDYRGFLVEGGKIELKTDDKAFFEYSIGSLVNGGFKVENLSEKLATGEIKSVITEYEKKFRELNMPVYYLTAVKN